MYCTCPRCSFHFSGESINLISEPFKNLFTLSANPLAHGAATAIFLYLIPCVSVKSLNSLEVNVVPRSETISFGKPKVLFNPCNQIIASFELVDLVG